MTTIRPNTNIVESLVGGLLGRWELSEVGAESLGFSSPNEYDEG